MMWEVKVTNQLIGITPFFPRLLHILPHCCKTHACGLTEELLQCGENLHSRLHSSFSKISFQLRDQQGHSGRAQRVTSLTIPKGCMLRYPHLGQETDVRNVTIDHVLFAVMTTQSGEFISTTVAFLTDGPVGCRQAEKKKENPTVGWRNSTITVILKSVQKVPQEDVSVVSTGCRGAQWCRKIHVLFSPPTLPRTQVTQKWRSYSRHGGVWLGDAMGEAAALGA